MSIKTAIISALVITVLVFSPLMVLAGTGYELTCENKSCNYKGNVNFGGGKVFDQITGYCVKSDKFVYLSWKRGTQKPAPLGQVWDPTTGKIKLLYKSKDCTEPFIPIESVGDLKYCPKCNKPTLKAKETVMFD
jgi:hypothetical protein